MNTLTETLTVHDVHREVVAVIGDRGDFVYEKRPSLTRPICRYEWQGEPDCIIAWWLVAAWDVDVDTLREADAWGREGGGLGGMTADRLITSLAVRGEIPPLTAAAVAYLSFLQREQDAGVAWGMAERNAYLAFKDSDKE